jgi:gamma-glutamyl:cysteine ligase YbdK (ATP-grasp superfamily)
MQLVATRQWLLRGLEPILVNAFTIGSEHELFVYGPGGRPASVQAMAALRSALERDFGVVAKEEFYRHQLEVITPAFQSVPAWMPEVERVLAASSDACAALDLHLSNEPVCGLAGRDDINREQFRRLLEAYPWHDDYPAICGIHIHLRFEDDRFNGNLFANLGWAAPALVAHWTSPRGSRRLSATRSFPRHGYPGSQDLTVHRDEMRSADRGFREHWFDYLWNARHDTLEIRFPDGDLAPDRLASFVDACLRLAKRASDVAVEPTEYCDRMAAAIRCDEGEKALLVEEFYRFEASA